MASQQVGVDAQDAHDAAAASLIEGMRASGPKKSIRAHQSGEVDIDVQDLDQPIAHRRGKRGSEAVSPVKKGVMRTDEMGLGSGKAGGGDEDDEGESLSCTRRRQRQTQAITTTPSRTKTRKRVRFSDPGRTANATSTSISASASTGLTPNLSRTTLLAANSTSRSPVRRRRPGPRRRASTPAAVRTVRTMASATPAEEDGCEPMEVEVEVVQFTPLRQQLDARSGRRLRRNRLSEEMNMYEAEVKERLRSERITKMVSEVEGGARYDCGGITADHEATVEEASGAIFQDANDDDDDAAAFPTMGEDGVIAIHEDDADDTNGTTVSMQPETPSKAVPRSSQSMTADQQRQQGVYDTTADQDLLAMALDLESSKREKARLFKELQGGSHHSFRDQKPEGNPQQDGTTTNKLGSSSSPHSKGWGAVPEGGRTINDGSTGTVTGSFSSDSAVPSPPKSFYADVVKALRSTTHRAETTELALHALESELVALGFADPHKNRADEVAKDDDDDEDEDSDQDQSSKSHSILTNIRTQFRLARIELERILPGETVSGLDQPAAVLPEALSKLKMLSRRVVQREAELRSMYAQQRTLKGNFECGLRAAEKAGRRIKELEDNVEQGADDLLHLRIKLQGMERDEREKDHTVQSLIKALEKYRDDVARLEGLVVRLEEERGEQVRNGEGIEQQVVDLQVQVGIETEGRRKAEQIATTHEQTIGDLHIALDVANDAASSLQIHLNAVEAQQRAESEAAQQLSQHQQEAHSHQQREHDAHVQALNTRLSNLGTALATSQSETARLDRLVAKLRSRLSVNDDASARAMDASWHELVRSVTKCHENRKSWIRASKVRNANWELEDESEAQDELLGQGGGDGGAGEPMTPVSLVRFADDLHDNTSSTSSPVGHRRGLDEEDDDDDQVPGRVEMARGRSSRKSSFSLSSLPQPSSSGLGIGMADEPPNQKYEQKTKRTRRTRTRRSSSRLDSGIGMGCLSEVNEDQQEGEGQNDLARTAVAVESSSDAVAMIHSSSLNAISLPPPARARPGFEIHEDDASDLALPSSDMDMLG